MRKSSMKRTKPQSLYSKQADSFCPTAATNQLRTTRNPQREPEGRPVLRDHRQG